MRSEELQRISCLLLEVKKLLDVCCEERKDAQSKGEKFEWWIALQNVTQFSLTLSNDLDAVSQSFLSPANNAGTLQPQVRSIEYVKSEYTRLTMKYYQQPAVWKTKLDTLGWGWVFPKGQRGCSPSDPVEYDEIPRSTQSTTPSSCSSEQQPGVPREFYKPPSSRGLKFSSLNKALNEHPPALQSSARIFACPPTPTGESAEGALDSSRFILAPPAAPPLKPPQLSSSYGSGLAFFTRPTADRVETGYAAIATLDQPFSTPTNNAAGRGSLPSHYSYHSEPAPLHNHVEMPSLYDSRAYPSQTCGYVNMPTSSTSCARAQQASTSGNWVSSLSPTAVQAYNESSYYDTEEQLLCPESTSYKDYPMSPLDWSRFSVDRDLPLSHDGAKGVEDFNSPAQPYSEPLIFNGPVHTQPVLDRARFDHTTSQELLPRYNWAQSQPALNTAQLDRPTPRPAVSSWIIQPDLDQPSIYDQVPRQPAFDSAQFEPVRRVPATRNNPTRVEAFRGSRSYLEQTAGDTAYHLQPSRTAAAAPANYNVNPISWSYNDTHDNPSTAYAFPGRSSLLLGGLANQDVVSFQRSHHQGVLKK